MPVPRRGAWGHPPVSAVPRAAAGNGKKRWREVGGEGNQKCHFVFFWLILFFPPHPSFIFSWQNAPKLAEKAEAGAVPLPAPGREWKGEKGGVIPYGEGTPKWPLSWMYIFLRGGGG